MALGVEFGEPGAHHRCLPWWASGSRGFLVENHPFGGLSFLKGDDNGKLGMKCSIV